MFQYKEYVRAKSIEEAYELAQKKNNVVLGGTLWLKMGDNPHGTAIDLCDLGLDRIEETEEAYRIGAYVTLRELETHEGLNAYTQGAMEEAMKHIVGVQFRNTATLGGSIWGRFGFSDVYSIFLALGAEVELFHAGRMSLEDFAKLPRSTRDILTHVVIKKNMVNAVYLSQRNSRTDFPVLTCALAVDAKGQERVVIGARPSLAKLCSDGEWSSLDYDSNLRASEEYRRRIAEVLVRRAREAVEMQKNAHLQGKED